MQPAKPPPRPTGFSTLCRLTALLALPAVLGQTTPSTNSPARWEKEIAAFEAADRTNPPPANAILFLGSSSIRLWKTLAEDFAGRPVINRGFGGSYVADSTAFVDRIVLPYRPRQIVFYAGDNDLAGGKSPAQVETDFQQFVSTVHRTLPQCGIAFIAIKPSPARWSLVNQQKEANERVRRFTQPDQRLAFIDVFTPMLASDGQPRAELFAADKLHLNAEGYRLWRTLVRPHLK